MRSTKRSTLSTENTIETLAAEKGGALRREREREGGRRDGERRRWGL